jgi:hypothetical protein
MLSGIDDIPKSFIHLFLLFILGAGLFLVVSANLCVVQASESSGIPKPSVPEFIVEIIGYHVVLKIKNEPIESYFDPSPDCTLRFYYNIRYKTPGGSWEEVYRPSDFYKHQDLGSEYTTVSFVTSTGSVTFSTENRAITVHSDEISFQVEAMIGGVNRCVTAGPMAPWVFTGETSGWSESQTVSLGSSAPTTPDEPTEPEPIETEPTELEPTEPEPTEPEPTETEEESYPMEQLAIILGVVATVISVAALGIGLLVYFKIRKH